MPRARVVTKEYKDHLGSIFKDLLKRKATIVSIVLVVAGTMLVAESYHFPDTVKNPNVFSSNVTAGQSVSSVLMKEPTNVTMKVVLTMPANESVHYELIKYDSITKFAKQYDYYSVAGKGNATNNSIINVGKTYGASQDYLLNLSANSTGSFKVNVVYSYFVIKHEYASKYMIGSGVVAIIAGVILLSYSISRAFDSRNDKKYK